MIIGMGQKMHKDYASLQDKLVTDGVPRQSYELRVADNAWVRNMDSKDGQWKRFDAFFNFRNNVGILDVGEYDWKNPTGTKLTKGGVVQYSYMDGIAGDGISGKYVTPFVPSLATNFVNANASVCYDLLDNQANAHYGGNSVGDKYTNILGGASMRFRINEDATTGGTLVNNPGAGHWIANKDAANVNKIYKNGVDDTTPGQVTVDDTNRSGEPINLLSRNNGGTTDSFSTARLGYVAFGGKVLDPVSYHASLNIYKNLTIPEPPIGPASDYLVFLIQGDSISAGRGEVPGPIAPVETVYEWDGVGHIIDRATTEFSNVDPGNGSPWKQMAIDLNAATGKKIVFVCCGSSGSEFYPNGNTNNWYTSGVLYTPSVTKANACLAYLGKSALDGVCQILGINDARNAQTTANIKSAMVSLYDRINTDFPGVPIYASSIGMAPEGILTSRIAEIKNAIRLHADTRSYYNIVANLTSFSDQAWDLYGVDLLHLSQAGNNLLGSLYARYIAESESNKEVKQVWNAFQSLTSAHKAAWKTWVEALEAAGIWNELESFSPAVGSNLVDVQCDVRLLGGPAFIGTPTFTANDSLRHPNTSNYRRILVNPQYSWRVAGQNDFVCGIKIKTNHVAAGVQGSPFGVTSSTGGTHSINVAQQATSNLTFMANDVTGTVYATHTKIQDNTLYSVYRTGTTKGLAVNGASVQTAVQASIANMALTASEGNINNNGTPGTALDCSVEYSYEAKWVGFNISTFYTACETLLTALRTP